MEIRWAVWSLSFTAKKRRAPLKISVPYAQATGPSTGVACLTVGRRSIEVIELNGIEIATFHTNSVSLFD
jgi:hypothetical protein